MIVGKLVIVDLFVFEFGYKLGWWCHFGLSWLINECFRTSTNILKIVGSRELILAKNYLQGKIY